MSQSIKADFSCDACDAIAATICFVLKGEQHPLEFIDPLENALIGGISGTFDRLTVTGFCASTSEKVVESGDVVRAALLSSVPARLFQINQLWAPFYCGECKKSYCSEHWTTRDCFDDDPPGWYDRTVANCPNGHGRVIAD